MTQHTLHRLLLQQSLLLCCLLLPIISATGLSCTAEKMPEDLDRSQRIITERGIASWYGPGFHGRATANGETYDMHGLTAAHRTLPFNTVVRVTNLDNGEDIVVRINDRGPFAHNRIIDLSKEAADKIGVIGPGTASVLLEIVNKGGEVTKDLKTPHFAVQIGSFRTEEAAAKLQECVHNSRIQWRNINNQDYYRVHVGYYSTVQSAERMRRTLRRQGFAGFVKQVEN